MNISWGIKIAAVYIIFVLIVLGTVLFSTTQEVNLVTDDYYQKEIEYQSHIDKIKRTKELPEQIFVKLKDDYLTVTIPELFKNEKLNGEIVLYRPSDNRKDFRMPLTLNDNLEHSFSTTQFDRGLWKIQIEWAAENLDYFHEQILMLN